MPLNLLIRKSETKISLEELETFWKVLRIENGSQFWMGLSISQFEAFPFGIQSAHRISALVERGLV